MDQNGGIGPTGPRLDTTGQQPQPNTAYTGAPLAIPGESQAAASQNLAQSTLPVNPMAPTPVDNSEPPQNIQPDAPFVQQTGPDNKKVTMIAIGSIVICLVLSTATFFVGFSSGKSAGRSAADHEWQQKEAERQAAEKEKNKDDSADVAEELELGELEDPEYLDETIEGEIGDQTTASDGLVLKVTNIERNFKTDDANYQLPEAKELVKVNFIIGNITKDKPKDINSFGFRLENSSSAKLVPENITEYPDKFDTVKLDPGSQTRGSIVYLVNKDEVPLKFVREQIYRISGQNREVTTRTVVVVAK